MMTGGCRSRRSSSIPDEGRGTCSLFGRLLSKRPPSSPSPRFQGPLQIVLGQQRPTRLPTSAQYGSPRRCHPSRPPDRACARGIWALRSGCRLPQFRRVLQFVYHHRLEPPPSGTVPVGHVPYRLRQRHAAHHRRTTQTGVRDVLGGLRHLSFIFAAAVLELSRLECPEVRADARTGPSALYAPRSTSCRIP